MAPGISAITRLSVTSMVAIDRVSAANTTLSAPKNPSPAWISGNVDSA